MTAVALITSREELKRKFLEIVTYLFKRGEMLKTLRMLYDAPSIIEEDPDILSLITTVKSRLADISEVQRYGTVKGRVYSGFVDPANVVDMVKFKRLSAEVQKLGLKKMVDVGCYTGWIGRNLDLLKVAVHGIDVHPVVMFYASIASSGTLATFEYLPVEKLGFTHPLEYDGAILFDVLEHVFDPVIAIKSAEMSVRDGGWLFYNIPHPEAEHRSPVFHNPADREHLHSFSESKLKELFKDRKNLTIEKIDNEEGSFNWWVQYEH